MSLKLNRKQLVDLIETMEAEGTDATALRQELAALGPEETTAPSHRSSRREGEEETSEERLTRRVGDLFPEGIPFQEIRDYDYRFTLKELREQAREAGLSLSGDKKELAAKLIAHNRGYKDETRLEEATIVGDKIDMSKQMEWAGKPGDLAIPHAYITDLRYEIVVFARKERGGSDFTFRCREYKRTSDGQWTFTGVVIDTSKLNANGEVMLARFSYHPEVVLVNVGFMVYPAPEGD